VGTGLFQKLLVSVDWSEGSRKAAAFAIRMAGRERCELTAVHVIDEANVADIAQYIDRPPEAILDKMRDSGNQIIEEVRRMAVREGVHLKGELRIGIPHRELLAAARENHVDLIVIGSVGRKGPRRVLIGSVTERVIEQSSLPVLVVK